ncbi:unnamed protein product [Brachionus calyciflorus]|uniref:Homeobox domain-containing protein n=1 Tax=Brachionus calyciflorus TaxID=104777 RepID=A0A813LXG3_9BILA|nr:unnamed protein product [Brachionus calyciflorus]
MNPAFENNDFKNTSSNRQDFLRLPNTNFSLGNDPHLDQFNYNQALSNQNQFSNGYLQNNDNLIGVLSSNDTPQKYSSFKTGNYGSCSSFNDSNLNSFNGNNFSPYIHPVARFQNEQVYNENLIRFNFLQQFDPNFKQYHNFVNNQKEEISTQHLNFHQTGNQDSSNSYSSEIGSDLGTVVESPFYEQKTKKAKKSRILFSQWQINELEKLFKKQKYVTSNERELMAKRLKLQANQVKIWFQNRRYKIKKQNEAAKE